MKHLVILLALSLGLILGIWVQSNTYPITKIYEDGSFVGCKQGAQCND